MQGSQVAGKEATIFPYVREVRPVAKFLLGGEESEDKNRKKRVGASDKGGPTASELRNRRLPLPGN